MIYHLIISNKKYLKYIKNKTNSWEIYTDDKNSIELDLFDLNSKKFKKK